MGGSVRVSGWGVSFIFFLIPSPGAILCVLNLEKICGKCYGVVWEKRGGAYSFFLSPFCGGSQFFPFWGGLVCT